MRILCYGSLNIDHVYQMPHIVVTGETLASTAYKIYAGGKGLNQSIAMSRAGLQVYHAGKIGPEGRFLKKVLETEEVDTSNIKEAQTSTGHAIIQVTPEADNCILLYSGANKEIDMEEIESVLTHFHEGDLLVLQNEINDIHVIAKKAREKGMLVALNPSPINEALESVDFHDIHYLIFNEVEGEYLTGEKEPDAILKSLSTRYPHIGLLLTCGKDGAYYQDKEHREYVEALSVEAVDTTAAGDTFMGYFLSGLAKGASIRESMMLATKAASITVTNHGAATSIPYFKDIQ